MYNDHFLKMYGARNISLYQIIKMWSSYELWVLILHSSMLLYWQVIKLRIWKNYYGSLNIVFWICEMWLPDQHLPCKPPVDALFVFTV
jgi:hypothetical protein